MKKIVFICILINISIFSVFSYYLFFRSNDNELIYMIDVINLEKQEVSNLLDDYELEFIYIDSNKEKDSVVYTSPKVNEITQKGQKISIYLSTGEEKIYYDNLVNKYYEANVEYLEFLENEYNINVIIENQLSDDYPNGVIVYQSTNGIINKNDTFIITVNYNNSLILIPNLIGKTENEVISIFKDEDIILHFIYDNNSKEKLVYKQSIEPNSLVIKGTILYIYISI